MSFLDRLKKVVGVAAMTNPVTALAWKGLNASNTKSAPPAKAQAVMTAPAAPSSDEHEAAAMAGGPEMEAFQRSQGSFRRKAPYYFPAFIKGGKVDDDDLATPTFRAPPRQQRRGRDDLASPTRGKLPPRPQGGSDDLVGFACSVLGVERPAPATSSGQVASPTGMNNLADNSVVSHDAFRALVWRNACKASGGKKPNAPTIAAAQAAVLQFFKLKGIRISLPGAKPGRRTV